jgi:hypothetical protein
LLFHCQLDYDPEHQYTRREMIDLIVPHRDPLCFFAHTSGYRRCVLGLGFDKYDPADGFLPVVVINDEQAQILVAAQGRKFKQAYQSSRPGKSIVVTFTSPSCTGWFRMK